MSELIASIVQAPDKVLSTKCRPAKWGEVDAYRKKLYAAEAEYQKYNPKMRVVGMAAPQIGVPIRMFIAMKEVFINPTVIKKSKQTIKSHEGCCSIPADLYETERPAEIQVRWFTPSRQMRMHTFFGSFAVVVQHELDHLSGIMLVDHGKVVKKAKLEKSS